MRHRALALVVTVCAWSAAAAAPPDPPPDPEMQSLWEMPFEDLSNIEVASTSFFSLHRLQAPASSYVITNDLIAPSPAQNLSELLDFYVPGVHMGTHPWWGAGLFGSRGILVDNNAKTTFMIDGFNVNQRNIIGSGPVFASPLMGDMEQYEVIMGPGSIVHGSGAINGFVNAVPRTGERHRGLRATAKLGHPDALVQGELGYGLAYGQRRNLFVYVGFVQADGFRPRALSWVGQPIPERLRAFDVGPSFKTSAYWNHGGFSLNVFHSHLLAGTQTPATLDSPALPSNLEDPWGRSTLLGVRPQYALTLGKDGRDEVIASGGLLLQDSGMQARYPERQEGDKTLNVSNGGRETYAVGRLIYRTKRLFGTSLALGLENTYRKIEKAKHFFSEPARLLPFEHQDLDFTEHSVFAEDIVTRGKWTLSGALRYDLTRYPSAFDATIGTESWRTELDDTSHLSGRATVAFAATPKIMARLMYQNAFRSPDAGNYALAATGNRELARLGRPPLAPLDKETMDSFEANLHCEDLVGGLTLDINGYYNVYDGLLAFNNVVVNDTSVRTYVNAGDAFGAVGGEITAGSEPVPSTRWQLAYGYSRPAQFSADANQFFLQLANDERDAWARYPMHQIKAHVTTGLHRDTLVLHGNVVVESPLDPFVTRATHEVLGRKRLLVNAAVSYRFHRRVAAKLSVLNAWRNTVPAINYANERPWRQNQLGIERRRVYLGLVVDY